VTNPTKQNRLGQDVGYALHPEGQPVLLADPSSSIAARAAFSTKHLWVTKYDQEQLRGLTVTVSCSQRSRRAIPGSAPKSAPKSLGE
jgi:hypothetical protein